MPDQAEPPSPRFADTVPTDTAGSGLGAGVSANGHFPRRFEAVLFDFHGTLAQVEDAVSWVRGSAADCGASLADGEAIVLADRLVMAGRAGGPLPRRVPPHLIEYWAERDLYAHAHRAAFTGLAETVAAHIDGLPEALYERNTTPPGWVVYSDAAETVRTLRQAGIRTAVVSNIGFDIRPLLDTFGMADLFDELILSYEIGRIKPDPAIFRAACAALRADPESTLMVGDNPNDAAAVAVGCAAYLVPAASPGMHNGLHAVAALANGHAPQHPAR